MLITHQMLDYLTAEAKASPRLRMNFDLRNSPEDLSQRMLNAVEPGTVVPVHRHPNTSETVVCIRGHFVEEYYNSKGKLIKSIDMVPGGAVLNVPAGQWHTLKCLESGTVLLECKDGKFEEMAPEDVLGGEPVSKPCPWKIHFLPVKYGDSFVIECGRGGEKGVVVVDGGPTGCGQVLQDKLKGIGTPDLLVLTHYDDDHIGGLTQYIKACRNGNTVPAKEVWANCAGYVQMREASRMRSINQGVKLSVILDQAAAEGGMTWRDDIDEGIVKEYPFAVIEVVSPTPEVRSIAISKQEEAGSKLALRKAVRPVDELAIPLEQLALDEPKAPNVNTPAELANAASIAFILRCDGLSVLMLGDCYPHNVEAYLRKKGYSEDNPLLVDYVKVAHHGSMHNTGNSLLDIIKCNHYIISTNGEKFKHPDRTSLAHILCHPRRDLSERVHLYFNCTVAEIVANGKQFLRDGEQEKWNFEIHEGATEIRPLQ